MYEANIAPFPFWGSNTNSKGGRDPLAVQNSSVVIYTNDTDKLINKIKKLIVQLKSING